MIYTEIIKTVREQFALILTAHPLILIMKSGFVDILKEPNVSSVIANRMNILHGIMRIEII